eukprot:TRINITY_DN5644_c0_g1_i1.p1 TRINITY_DN5644_c0_g1~~TRINITY_DN5644_c0_g1_i1.p1  ORF type:complete len:716 (-),score=191.18 TRINITY_DN5644_c0_g1_i1:19-1932(-)
MNDHFFAKLDEDLQWTVGKLESSIKKYYLVNAMNTGNVDKAIAFLSKYGNDLSNVRNWRVWFALPYTKNPANDAFFKPFFSKDWPEKLSASLTNLLGGVFNTIEVPKILNFNYERTKRMAQQREIESLKLLSSKLKEKVDSLTQFIEVQRIDLESQRREFEILKRDPLQPHAHSLPPLQAHAHTYTQPTSSQGHNTRTSPSFPPHPRQQITRTQTSKTASQTYDSKIQIIPLEDSSPVPPARPSTNPFDDMVFVGPSSEMNTNQRNNKHKSKSQGAIDRSPQEMKLVTESKDTPEGDKPPTDTPSSRKSSQKYTSNPTDFVFDENSKVGIKKVDFFSESSPINLARFSPDGSAIAVATEGGNVRIWPLDSSHYTPAAIYGNAAVTTLDWDTKTGKLLICGSNDGRVKLWNTSGDKIVGDIPMSSRYRNIVHLKCGSPTSNYFAVSSASDNLKMGGTLTLWDINKHTNVNKMRFEPPTVVTSITFNHNGSLLVATDIDGFIRVFDVNKGKQISKWRAHKDGACGVAFCADETSIFSVGMRDSIIQWSAHSPDKKLKTYQFNGIPNHSLHCDISLNNAGKYLIVSSKENGGLLYDVDQSRPLQLVGTHQKSVVSVDWHPELQSCLTAALDNTLCITHFN